MLLLGTKSSTGSSPSYLLLDYFTDSNSTAIGSHTMDIGPGWSSSSFEIQSNKLVATTADAVCLADAGASNGTMEAVISLPAGGYDVGILFNGADVNNFWLCQLFSSYEGIRLYSKIGGSYVERQLTSITIDNSTTYTLGVVVNGDDIDIYLDNSLVNSYSLEDRPLKTNTMWGIRAYNDTVTIDNFRVLSN